MTIAKDILFNADRGSIGFVVLAPVVLVNSNLAGGSGTPGSATSASGSTFAVGEVEGLGQDNDAGLIVSKVRDQLINSVGVDGGGITATGDALGETLSRAGHADCSGGTSENSGSSAEDSRVLHGEVCRTSYEGERKTKVKIEV